MTFSAPTPPSQPPVDAGDWLRPRPAAVTVVVVICYVEMVLAALGGLIAFIIAGVAAGSSGTVAAIGAVLGLVFLAVAVFLGISGHEIAAGSRTWRTVYIVVTLVLALGSLAQVTHQPSGLLGTIVDVVSVVLLLLPTSRAWFARR